MLKFLLSTQSGHKRIRSKKVETLAIIGFIFGLAALGKVLLLEKQLKEKGVLEQDDKEE
jgi:hypothetical protein